MSSARSAPARSRRARSAIPLLEHHQDPHHRAVVARMDGDVAVQQPIDEIGTDETTRADCHEAVARQLAQACMGREPHAERQPEAVFLLGDDLGREKVVAARA